MNYYKISLIIGLLLATCVVQAQDFDSVFGKLVTAYQTNNVEGLIRYATELKSYDLDNYAGDAFLAFAYCMKNDPDRAYKHIQIARNLNPIDAASYNIAGYVEWLKGNKKEATRLIHLSLQVGFETGGENVIIEDLEKIAQATQVDFSELIDSVLDMSLYYNGAPEANDALVDCVGQWADGKDCSTIHKYKNYFNTLSVTDPAIVAYADMLQGTYWFNAGRGLDAKNYLTAYLSNPAVKNATYLATPRAKSHEYIAAYYYSVSNYDAAYLNAKKGLEILKVIPHTTNTRCSLLDILSKALNAQGRLPEVLETAKQLAKESLQIKNNKFQISANNTLGSAYLTSTLPAERKEAFERLTLAYKLAKKTNDPELSNIIGNYAIALWQNGEQEMAMGLSLQAFDELESSKQYADAQVTINNVGFMAYYKKDYERSAKLFERAISITEKYRSKLPSYQRLAVMNEHVSAYSGLIMSYMALNDAQSLFEAQDLNRSRLLRERLDENVKPATLTATQRKLADDEVLLSYSLASPGEMIVSVVTKQEATIKYNYPIDSWLSMKKQILNKANKKPNEINGYITNLNEEIIGGKIVRYQEKEQAFNGQDFQDFVKFSLQLLESNEDHLKGLQYQFLRQWYDFLIAPVAEKIKGKRTIVICAEGALNHIPFETFMSQDDEYLLQQYNVKYIPSASVWSTLHERKYSEDRKPLIAFGGGTYGPSGNQSGSVRSLDDLLEIKEQINDKMGSESSLASELKALGFGGANYLPGTLKEVDNLKNVVPDAVVYKDQQMKESDLKALNANGELSKYKWVHLATHGFAMDDIPELSGIMMTQPIGGDGKEDMFLLSYEIAQLNLNADLAVLSACETALGRIYGGEGVNGLNSALLSAGANNTLLSLWPVNDAGTMIMMTVAYELMYKGNLDPEDAINETKRKMLAGEFGDQFKTPSMWAPFVLNGL